MQKEEKEKKKKKRQAGDSGSKASGWQRPLAFSFS